MIAAVLGSVGWLTASCLAAPLVGRWLHSMDTEANR